MSGFARRALRFYRAVDFAWVALVFAGLSFAAAGTLPTAGQILDRYVAVTGGANAWHAKHTERDEIEGRTLDGQRVVLRATVTVSRFGNSLSEIQIPQDGSEGVYKGVAWASSHFSGVRIKHGMERDQEMRDSRMLEEADWRRLYPASLLAGIEMVGRERCYKVLLLPSASGKTEWFNVSFGLLVKRSSRELSASGDTAAGFTVEEWAERDGIRQPAVMLASRGDLEYRLKILSTVYNEAHTDLRYPADVAAYLKADRAGQGLPNAEEIIERHIFESGGPEFYESLRTQRVAGTLTFPARNIEGRLETWAAGGGRYYQTTDIPGMGKQEEGSNGIIAWDRSPAIGPRVKPRRNAGALGVTLDAAGVLEWRVLIDRVRTEAQENVEGRDCYRVRLVPRDRSQDLIRWYDRKSGLLYRAALAVRTDMGPLPLVMTFEEYRTVSDVKWPSRIRITASGQDSIFAADEVKLNEPVDDAIFEVPAEILELARKRAGADPAAP
jgi:hypothetical protein